jgi:HK97 gp10 family phage protein
MSGTKIRITKLADDDDLGRKLEPKMANLGQAIARRMQRLVPKKTYNLHDTIAADTERIGAKVTLQVGVGGNGEADYWEYVERGTSRQAAQPYMRPALLQSTGRDLLGKGGN